MMLLPLSSLPPPSSQVTLQECDSFDLQVLKSPSDYMAAATSTETTERLEGCMKVWIKQIEQVRCCFTANEIFPRITKA